MEEKEVTMSGQDPKTTDEKKEMTFDELKNIATQLAQQNRALQARVNELMEQLDQVGGIQARLHYLFKILENRSAFGDPDYIITVCEEIKNIMTIKEEQPTENSVKE